MVTLIVNFFSVALSAGLLLGFAEYSQAQSIQAWKITTRQSDALAETRIGSMFVRLHGKCSSTNPYVVVHLEGYRGNALRKIDQAEQPVTFIAEGLDGSRTEHRGTVFMFGDQVTMPDTLPAFFIDRLVDADRLLIHNKSGQSVLAVSLVNARQFPGRLARLCGNPKPQSAEAQPTSGGKSGPLKDQVISSLPLKRGFYVASDTLCSQASNATLQLMRRDGLGVARQTCSFKRIVQTGPTLYRVDEDCRSIEGGPAEKRVRLFQIPDDSSFSVGLNGQPHRARYCVQSSLPSPWRNNNISDLIR